MGALATFPFNVAAKTFTVSHIAIKTTRMRENAAFFFEP